MKLLECEVSNFGSYESLRFNYSGLGLSLVYGPTGAGKSTLMDIPCWILFGVTAKNGAVDDVRNWSNMNTSTKGSLAVCRGDVNGQIVVTRVRGKQSENDLYWEDDAGLHRGKDITETQRLLEETLGISADLYCAGAYFSEFSPSASFFTAKTKDKRALLENVAPLEMPVKLLENLSKKKKEEAGLLNDICKSVDQVDSRMKTIEKYLGQTTLNSEKWEQDHAHKLEVFKLKSSAFEFDKENRVKRFQGLFDDFEIERKSKLDYLTKHLGILEIPDKCPTCGRFDSNPEDYLKTKEQFFKINEKLNPYQKDLDRTNQEINNYGTSIVAELAFTNPYSSSIKKLNKDLELDKELHETLLKEVADRKRTHAALEQLQEAAHTLRGQLLQQAVNRIQSDTNMYMSRFFDSEIMIQLDLEGSDDLKVTLFKNGYECNFKQLSKGQRGLIKLTFALAIMKSSSMRNGAHFSTIFLDEAVDGLDPELKVKAFNLFSELGTEHESVLVIDHSLELKTLFHNKYEVRMENDISIIKSV